MSESQPNVSRREYVARINRVVDYIKANLDGNLSLDTLAGVALFSKFYFHRIFKSMIGESLGEFVTRARIERAAFMLANNRTTPITEIALQSGFSGSSTFSKAFRTHYNMSPRQWRLGTRKQSKIGKVDGNLGEEAKQQSLYIDLSIKTPTWRVSMNNDSMINVQVRTMPAISIAYVRHYGMYDPADKALFQGLFAKLLQWAIPRKLFNPPVTKAMTVFSSGHPQTSNPENLSVDACISIDPEVMVSGDVAKRILPGGQYAVVTMVDSTMDACGKAWDQVFNHWLPDSGYQPGEGAYYILYLSDPEQHPQKLFNVEMYLPVKPL